MKVYVITKGSYSDYHICGVVTDQEAAEKLVKLYSDSHDDAEIEVFDTDRPLSYLTGRLPFKVYFYNAGGCHAFSCIEDEDFKNNEITVFDHRPPYGSEMAVTVTTTDETHAIKIACDMRAQYLAEKAGI